MTNKEELIRLTERLKQEIREGEYGKADFTGKEIQRIINLEKGKTAFSLLKLAKKES